MVKNPLRHIVTYGRASVQTTVKHLTYNITKTSKQILPANGQRAYLCFQNNSIGKIYLYFGDGPATADNGILLGASQFFEPKKVPIEPIYAISNLNIANLVVLEGT